ncbi:MAG: hypothetical protein K8F30_08215 [Taibaiella sp.]|nr:hypothetical protein [Taibaiella sp.]
MLGEGAGIVVLESREHAEARGAHIYAELISFGSTSDAGHITKPDSEGSASAMLIALKRAHLAPSDVGYINAHGTGTLLNDVTETEAIRKAFGSSADAIPVSSCKSMIGHTLGASGALELVITTTAMCESWIPPTANFTAPGEGCDLDFVPNSFREHSYDIALSNSFAFGGMNSVLAIKKWREP